MLTPNNTCLNFHLLIVCNLQNQIEFNFFILYTIINFKKIIEFRQSLNPVSTMGNL